jgi:6-phosphofructokinase 1
MKRLAILTGGGDAPGLNAVIRAVVKTAIQGCNCEILGIRDGFEGFIKEKGIFPLDTQSVRGILPRGGTILGTANRGNPFARKIVRNGKTVIEDTSGQIIANIKNLKLDALIVVGGDGTLRIAKELFWLGVPVIGVPKTIDNDIDGTEITFGFDTAVSTATDAIDRLHTTAEAHHRVMVLELMGRNAGFIALYAGIAGGADVILIPEIPFIFETICHKIHQRIDRGTHFSIIAVAEGATAVGKQQLFKIKGDKVYSARLGGIGLVVANYVNDICGVEARVTVLGHLQRGGSPTAFDRGLASRYGSAAVRLALENKFGQMVALRAGKIVDVSIEDALAVPKIVDIEGDEIQTARALGISFGDE